MLEELAACEGSWHGTSRLQLDPEAGTIVDSPTTATITQLANGKFIRIDYSWTHEDKPHEGSYLVGHNGKSGEVTAHWIDSWHMGSKVMACTGTVDARGVISVLGAYEAPPGPDWGWSTTITPVGDVLRIVMNNIWPEGREDLAVDASYTRV